MIRILLLSLLINASVVSAHEHLDYFDDHFDIAGYVGYMHVWGSPKPTPIKSEPEVGLLVNYNITNNWRMFTQFRLEPDHLKQSVSYAFLEYHNNLFSVPIRITAGKIRHHYGLFNKDRLNPTTRPGVVAPQAMYWNQLRFAITSGYGFAVEAKRDNWFVKYTIDRPIIVDKKAEALIWFSGTRTTIKRNFGGHQSLNLEYNNNEWRVASTIILQDWGYGESGKHEIVTLGVERMLGPLTLSLEAMGVFKYQNNSYALSGTIQYDAHENVTLHTNYNRYHIIFKEYTPAQDAYFTKADDVSVGVSLHKNNWDLRSEVHAVHGSVWVDFTKAQDPDYGDWWYYGATSLVYHF